jgi:hypothetical protein
VKIRVGRLPLIGSAFSALARALKYSIFHRRRTVFIAFAWARRKRLDIDEECGKKCDSVPSPSV